MRFIVTLLIIVLSAMHLFAQEWRVMPKQFSLMLLNRGEVLQSGVYAQSETVNSRAGKHIGSDYSWSVISSIIKFREQTYKCDVGGRKYKVMCFHIR